MPFKTAGETLKDLKEKRVSSLELVEEAIKTIETHDEKINAVIVRDFERARETAKLADEAIARGEDKPLLGLPITVKEAYNVAGLPTTWGVPGTQDIKVKQDAVTISRLKDAGAVILGKTNVCMFLADWQSFNSVYGTTNNPWDPTRTPGGSSGGSAASLAAGYVSMELGSDIGGSLRIPAHFCGVYAHKPTYNLIPTRGHTPPGVPLQEVEPFIDFAVSGPMARSADDLMLGLDVLSGPDAIDAAYNLNLPAPRRTKLADYRILVLDEHPLIPTSTEIRDQLHTFADKLEQAGCKIDRSGSHTPDLALISKNYLKMLSAVFSADLPPEVYQSVIERVEKLDENDDSVDAAILRGTPMSHRDWINCDRIRTHVKHLWIQLFKQWDVVIMPVTPTVAFEHNHEKVQTKRRLMIDDAEVPYLHQSMWIHMPTFTGNPATAIPIGKSPAGLPIGAQIMGPHLEDRTTITFASLIEKEFGGFTPPPGF